MLSHDQIWAVIDRLAERQMLSASALARKAGLDPTTFNKSKRISAEGRPRWPSTESLAKILEVTGMTSEDALLLIGGKAQAARAPETKSAVPLLGLAQAGQGGYFDDAGYPTGQGWEEIAFPAPANDNLFALEVTGDSMLPLYRDGDRLIVDRSAQVRKGDRVVVRTLGGEVMAKTLARQTTKTIELHSLNPQHENRVLDMAEIDWIGRITWASQ